MKKIIILSLVMSLISCAGSRTYYLDNNDKSNGLDFSKGKWLIGEIDVNKSVKENLTKVIIDDFTYFLNDRVKYALDEKSLLLNSKFSLNPSKSEILDLKKGTGFDYFINIKCQNGRNDLSNFDLIDHNYYIKQINFAVFYVEVYDLNKGEIIYLQRVRGKINEDDDFTSRPTYAVIMGCYKRIIEDIKTKEVKKSTH